MAKTSPVRVNEELFASAQIVGPLMSRSAAQQIEHWARIGRELEAAESVSHTAIQEVLDGLRNYDRLSSREQAVVRAEWEERLTARRDALNLAERFVMQSRSYVEVDDDGNVVRRQPQSTVKRKPRRR